jgi:hypothetical protein
MIDCFVCNRLIIVLVKGFGLTAQFCTQLAGRGFYELQLSGPDTIAEWLRIVGPDSCHSADSAVKYGLRSIPMPRMRQRPAMDNIEF